MQTIRAFITMLVFGVVTLYVFNGCSDPTQKAAAADLRISEADLQGSQQKFENMMEIKIAEFRRSLDEMKAPADDATFQTKITINLHHADLERQLKAVETGLAELKAIRASNKVLRSAMEVVMIARIASGCQRS